MSLKIPSVVLMWILAGLTVLASALGLVEGWLQANTTYTVASVVGLVVSILTMILNFLTQNTVNKIVAALPPGVFAGVAKRTKTIFW